MDAVFEKSFVAVIFPFLIRITWWTDLFPAHTESCTVISSLTYNRMNVVNELLCVFPGLVLSCVSFWSEYIVIPSYSHLPHLCMHKCMHACCGIVTQLSTAAGVNILRCVWLLARRPANDGTATSVWIKGSGLVSDKHWISAVISLSLAQTWNWHQDVSSSCFHTCWCWRSGHRSHLPNQF